VGGFDETCDGLSGEDYVFGTMLQNSGRPIYYDPRLMLVEDRTEGQCGPTFKRSDYGTSPDDWSHKLLSMVKDRKTALHSFDIRSVRDNALAGKPWPTPWGPFKHAWDGVPLEKL
jgi:hypothetical protein